MNVFLCSCSSNYKPTIPYIIVILSLSGFALLLLHVPLLLLNGYDPNFATKYSKFFSCFD